MNSPSLPVLSLNPAEAVFAPFHDEWLRRALVYSFEPVTARGCRTEDFWCDLRLHWDSVEPGQPAAVFRLTGNVRREHYDHLIFCLVVPAEVEVRFVAETTEGPCALTEWRSGSGQRMEITAPLPKAEIRQVEVHFRCTNDHPQIVALHWFGLGNQQMLTDILRPILPYGHEWNGLIQFPDEWPESPAFDLGLLFDAVDLAGIREKLQQPDWAACFQDMEARARQGLLEAPERWLGEFIPWSDSRYLRARETPAPALFNEALVTGFVAIVRRDVPLAWLAVRQLMVMVHTTHWCVSGEERLRGSTWDQRCFTPEMTATAVALLTDWFAWALTPAAHELIRQSLWDKGLAVIERDMMKFEYVYHINQGPWFCRARVLAGLLLEKHWPRTNGYVDRAFEDMREGLNHYLMPDGGTDEGIGYFLGTMESALPAVFAYGKARGVEMSTLLPENPKHSENFLRTLSAMRPGHFLLDGDNSDTAATSDAVLLLARLFPDQCYRKIALASLAPLAERSYYRQYWKLGVYGCIFGPADLPESRGIVPDFSMLPHVGHLTSLRFVGKHSVRLHFAGAKANASHTHLDKGNFTLEVNGTPCLVDRGTLRYDDSRVNGMVRSSLHNVLTPVGDTGAFWDQASISESIIPQGRQNGASLEAEADLSNVWRGVMHSCHRKIVSPKPDQFFIKDSGLLREPRRLAFHLQSPAPFRIDGTVAYLTMDGFRVTIRAEWAESIRHAEESVEWNLRPVWRLTLLSSPRDEFNLVTSLELEFD